MFRELSNATIHYIVVGQGRPLLVLHGWMTDHRYMKRLLEPAFDKRDGWRRIYLDIPGHGKSKGTDAIMDSDNVLEALLEFIDLEVKEERFAVAGTSYGSILARGVVAKRSADLSGFLLVAPDVDHGSEGTILPPRTVIVKSELDEEEISPMERRLFENELVVQTDEALAVLRKDVAPAFETADSAFLERLSENYTLSFEDRMRTQVIDCPGLFIMGRQDHQTGYHNVWSVLENYPRATFAVLDRAGHTVGGVEQAKLCTALIREWLDRVEEYLAE